jgi:CO/xanthine dehydrogenase FAD-binding subunit
MRQVFLPTTLEALWDILDREPDAALFAGGTDLLVNLRAGSVTAPSLVCLERIDEIKGVTDRGDRVFIGAATTHSHLLENPIIRTNFPVLTQAVRVLGSPLIRNMGTIGGNIVNASPAGDALPPLYVLGAEVEIRSRHFLGRMPIGDFIVGPGQVRLEKGRLVSGIWILKVPEYPIHHYEKVGRRKSQACSIAGMAAILRLSDIDAIDAIRLAWGSVGPTVVTSPEIERVLTGQRLCREAVESCVPLVEKAVSPISDIRASAEYRRVVCGKLLLRLVTCSKPVHETIGVTMPRRTP